MIDAMEQFKGQKLGILGAARSGLAAARAAMRTGAEVYTFDDQPKGLAAATSMGCMAGSVDDLSHLAAMIVSPGIPLTHPTPHPIIERCRASGVPILGDIEPFVHAAKAKGHKVIAVTGTNGKSTTTALIGHLLQAVGLDPLVGGNIGLPVFELEPTSSTQPIVLELSSFQLDLCQQLAPDIAIWLNLTSDHLDRHGDLAGYVAAKRKIFAGQQASDLAVIGIDDAIGWALETSARQVRVGDGGDVGFAGGKLVIDGRVIVDLTSASGLLGAHNWQNAAVALAAVSELTDQPAAVWQRAFESFPGLPHRMQQVAACGGVRFVNDSKATNPDAASKSLASFAEIFWIAGGKSKPGGFKSLAPLMGHVKRGYLIGDAAAEIAQDLGDSADLRCSHTMAAAMDEAFRDARQTTAVGDLVILLAPACASFDQFASFEDRGDQFRAQALKLCALETAL